MRYKLPAPDAVKAEYNLKDGRVLTVLLGKLDADITVDMSEEQSAEMAALGVILEAAQVQA